MVNGFDSFVGKLGLTTMPDKPYKILCDDITKGNIFDHKKKIESIDYSKYYGPKYVTDTYNNNTKTYIMEFKELNGYEVRLCKYTFDNNMPISTVICLESKKDIAVNALKKDQLITSPNDYSIINTDTYNVYNQSNFSYPFSNIQSINEEERIRFIIETKTQSISRFGGWTPCYFYPKEQYIQSHLYNIKDMNNNIISIYADNSLQLLTDYYINKRLDNNTYDPVYINKYYRSTYSPYYDGGTDETNLNNVLISMFPILYLSGYNYKAGVDNGINPPISKYLSAIVLDENGYTRGLPAIIDCKYNITGISGYALNQSLCVENITTSPSVLNHPVKSNFEHIIPSGLVLPNVKNLNLSLWNYAGTKKLKYSETYVIIPSNCTTISTSFYNTGTASTISGYGFLKFEDDNLLVTYESMFNNNKIIANNNICQFKFSKTLEINLRNLFISCQNLIYISKTNFDISECINITSVEGIFSNCSKLESIPNGLNFSSNTYNTNVTNMCLNCTNLSGIDNNNVFCCSSILTYDNMFNNCINLTTINESICLPSTFVSAQRLFQNCSSLTDLPLNFFPEVAQPVNISNICNNCKSITGVINVNNLLKNASKFKVIGTNAFKNCYNAKNYNSNYTDSETGITYYAIPTGWI